ncbi:MAG: hypothetical protein HWQ23_21635 [Nostoc sp. JL33]|nr:hypothetical protein [Nostoc sp. JL33]MBN3872772.1 hypothetical protein [Nostoc sp. JL33]
MDGGEAFIDRKGMAADSRDFQLSGISSKSGCSQPMVLNHIAEYWLDGV